MTWPPTEQFQFTFTIENYNNNLSSTSRKYLTMAPKFGYWSIQGVSTRILLALFFIILSFFKKNKIGLNQPQNWSLKGKWSKFEIFSLKVDSLWMVQTNTTNAKLFAILKVLRVSHCIWIKNLFIFYSSTVNSQHKIPWLESLGQSLLLPDPQRPATISSLRPHSNW